MSTNVKARAASRCEARKEACAGRELVIDYLQWKCK